MKLRMPPATVRLVQAAAEFVSAVRDEFAADRSETKWRRAAHECPAWCGGGHYCTAQHGYPSGQHRSEPGAWNRPYGRMVVTRVESAAGIPTVEILAVARVDARGRDETTAGHLAQDLLVGVDLVIAALTGGGPTAVRASAAEAGLTAVNQRRQVAIPAARPAVDAP